MLIQIHILWQIKRSNMLLWVLIKRKFLPAFLIPSHLSNKNSCFLKLTISSVFLYFCSECAKATTFRNWTTKATHLPGGVSSFIISMCYFFLQMNLSGGKCTYNEKNYIVIMVHTIISKTIQTSVRNMIECSIDIIVYKRETEI